MRFKRTIIIIGLLLTYYILCSAENVQYSAESYNPQEKKFSIKSTSALSVGTMLGCAYEYVLYNRELLSELRWPLYPSILYNAHFDVIFPKGIHFEGTLSLFQPMSTSLMQDKDFENVRLYPPSTEVTKFSAHSCTLIRGIRGVAKIGIQSELPQMPFAARNGITCTIEPMLSFLYSRISWQAMDGYSQHPPNSNGRYGKWHSGLPKQSLTGPSVSFQHYMTIPALGIGLTVRFPHCVMLYADVHATPDVPIVSEDIHYLKNKRFVDYIRGGWGMYSDVRLLWSFFYNISVVFGMRYEINNSMEGETFIFDGASQQHSHYSTTGSSGTELRGCTFFLGFAFIFGDK